jgi:hypothetical protein
MQEEREDPVETQLAITAVSRDMCQETVLSPKSHVTFVFHLSHFSYCVRIRMAVVRMLVRGGRKKVEGREKDNRKANKLQNNPKKVTFRKRRPHPPEKETTPEPPPAALETPQPKAEVVAPPPPEPEPEDEFYPVIPPPPMEQKSVSIQTFKVDRTFLFFS